MPMGIIKNSLDTFGAPQQYQVFGFLSCNVCVHHSRYVVLHDSVGRDNIEIMLDFAYFCHHLQRLKGGKLRGV